MTVAGWRMPPDRHYATEIPARYAGSVTVVTVVTVGCWGNTGAYGAGAGWALQGIE